MTSKYFWLELFFHFCFDFPTRVLSDLELYYFSFGYCFGNNIDFVIFVDVNFLFFFVYRVFLLVSIFVSFFISSAVKFQFFSLDFHIKSIVEQFFVTLPEELMQ